jgi:cell division protein FtsQ
MARKASPTILQEELYPPQAAERPYGESAREDFDDARLVDLDVDEESPFLRAQKRVSARRSSLPPRTAHRLLWAAAAFAALCLAAVAFSALYRYGERSWRFRVESSDNIEIVGTQNVTKAQIMEVMGADIGRNIFFIPLAQQKAQLEQIPWVSSASVMRFVPNRLRVEIHERTPVAFARVGPRIALIDAGGTLMELPPKRKYSFPVILGMFPGEPLSTRVPRMKAYNALIRDLDSGGARYSQDLSEVDLSDLDNLKVRVNDPAGDVLVELGSSDFLKRYKIYVSHAQEWRHQFQKLESVNLRYDNQVIVNPEMQAKKQVALAPAATKAAAAAGVKPAALITRAGPHDRVVPKPAFELTEKKLDPKAAAAAQQKPARARPKAKKVSSKPAAKKTPPVAKKTTPAVSDKNARNSLNHSGAHSASKPNAARPATRTPLPAHSALPKPSPAIAKQQGSQGPN